MIFQHSSPAHFIPEPVLKRGGGGGEVVKLLEYNGFLKPNSWTSNFVQVSGHNLASSQTWGFSMLCNVYITNQFQTTFTGWGGGGERVSLNRGDCEKQGGKLLRLVSQLRPRIRSQITIYLYYRSQNSIWYLQGSESDPIQVSQNPVKIRVMWVIQEHCRW